MIYIDQLCLYTNIFTYHQDKSMYFHYIHEMCEVSNPMHPVFGLFVLFHSVWCVVRSSPSLPPYMRRSRALEPSMGIPSADPMSNIALSVSSALCVCACVHACMRACVHACMHALCIHCIYVCFCVCLWIYADGYIHTYVLNIHTYVHLLSPFI